MQKRSTKITTKEINSIAKLANNGKLTAILQSLSIEQDVEVADTDVLIKQLIHRDGMDEALSHLSEQDFINQFKYQHSYALSDLIDLVQEKQSNEEKLASILQILKLGPHYTKEDIIQEIQKL